MWGRDQEEHALCCVRDPIGDPKQGNSGISFKGITGQTNNKIMKIMQTALCDFAPCGHWEVVGVLKILSRGVGRIHALENLILGFVCFDLLSSSVNFLGLSGSFPGLSVSSLGSSGNSWGSPGISWGPPGISWGSSGVLCSLLGFPGLSWGSPRPS